MYYGSYVFLGTTVQEISLKFNDLWGVIQKKKKKMFVFYKDYSPILYLWSRKKSEEIRRFLVF